MNFEIKPGTLCFVRRAAGWLAANNGKVVTVVREEAFDYGFGKTWACVSKDTFNGLVLPFQVKTTAAPGEEKAVPEVNLLPIAGPGLEADVRHYDSHPLIGKKVAVRVTSISARSTANVRR